MCDGIARLGGDNAAELTLGVRVSFERHQRQPQSASRVVEIGSKTQRVFVTPGGIRGAPTPHQRVADVTIDLSACRLTCERGRGAYQGEREGNERWLHPGKTIRLTGALRVPPGPAVYLPRGPGYV